MPATWMETFWFVVDHLQAFWRFELVRVGDTGIRVSQIVLALAILLVGLWLSKRVTRLVRLRLFRTRRVNANAAAVIAKILYYALLVIVTLVAMQTVNIPITIFTLLGGAIAIGIGFGAQNIFNNFISGVILMLEGHVRIGDMVDVEGMVGYVEEIGGRCTRIKRVDGVELLVPNSMLVENRVINWTLSDRRVRTVVRVGVAYGSPTDIVAELLNACARSHPKVLQTPEPRVVFDDFGNDALLFDVFFWTEITTMMELRTIRSDVRFAIDKAFREHHLSIAFPQRDVHLDATRPIPVHVVRHAEGAGDAHSTRGESSHPTA